MKREKHETLAQHHPPVLDNPEVIADNSIHLYSVPHAAGIILTVPSTSKDFCSLSVLIFGTVAKVTNTDEERTGCLSLMLIFELTGPGYDDIDRTHWRGKARNLASVLAAGRCQILNVHGSLRAHRLERLENANIRTQKLHI